MAIVNDERRELIAEIKLQYPDINSRIEELLTQYSVDDLKTIKETMKYDNELFQYRLKNQDFTISNNNDGSIRMSVSQENGETVHFYENEKRRGVVVVDDEGVLVTNTKKDTNETVSVYEDSNGRAYIDKNNIELSNFDDQGNEDKFFDLEINGNRVRGNFNVGDDAGLSFSMKGKISKDKKFSGKVKVVDTEYKNEFKNLEISDFDNQEEYDFAKKGGEAVLELEDGDLKQYEARDFMDFTPQGRHESFIAQKDKNGNMHIRIDDLEGNVLEGGNILEEENVAPIKGFIKSNLEDSNVIEENVVEPENKEIEAKNVNSKERVVEPVNEKANEESDVTEKETIIKATPYWEYSKRDGVGVNIYARYNKMEVHNVHIKGTGDTIKYSVLGDGDGNNLLHGALIYQDKDGNVIKDKCKVYDLGDEVNLDGKNVMLHASDRRVICRVDGKYLGPQISIREDDKSRTIGLDVYDGNGNLMRPSKNCSFMYIEEESNLDRENLKIDMRGIQAEDKLSLEGYSRLNDRVDERNNLSKQKNMVSRVVGVVER